MEPRPAPSRNAICIECRTVLGDGEACDAGPKHRVVRLDRKDGRAALQDEVWGPPSVRRRAKQLAKAGGGGAGVGALFDGCGSWDLGGLSGGGELAGAILFALFMALAAVLVWWIIMKIIEAVRAYRRRPIPSGAVDRPARHARTRLVGTVETTALALAPAPGGEGCAGYGLVLRAKRFLGGAIMLRDGATSGFDLVADDGRRVRVPAGRMRLEGKGEEVERTKVVSHLHELTRGGDAAEDDLELFPCDRAEEVVLRSGDRVELFADLDAVSDPDAPEGSYREGARKLLVARPPLVARRLA